MAKKLARTKTTRKPSPLKAKAASKVGPKASPKQATARKQQAAAKKTTAKAGKYVYFFGRKTDGNGSMKPLLGGKGANLAEMCRIGLPVPPGFTITTEVCTYYYANKRTYPPALRAPDGSGHRLAREADRQDVRRPEEPAAGLGPLGRARLDAGHDGHDPQPRPQRPDRRGARDEDRQRALRLGLLPPLRADVRRRRPRRAEAAGRGSRPVRDGDSRPEARALSPGHRGHEADRRRSEGTGRPVQGAGQGARRQAVPRVALGSAARRRRRRVRLVDERSRDRLSPEVQHSDRVGHRGQRAGDGLRQHRRRVRDRASRSRATRRTASRSSTASS